MQKLLIILVWSLLIIGCSDGSSSKNDSGDMNDSTIADDDSGKVDEDIAHDIDSTQSDSDMHDDVIQDADQLTDDTENIDDTTDDIPDDTVDEVNDTSDVDEHTDSDDDTITDPEEYSFDGIVQKGPFIKDSSIKVTELDNNFEMIPATTFTTKTVDDLGNFNIKRKFKSRYIEIEATGFYYDEVAGTVSSAQITNYVFVDLYANKSKVNINILTTLARKRIQHLMKNGSNYTEATTQSETELLEIFGIYGELSSNFQDMNILQPGSSNAMLLAISARLQGNNTPGELSNLIAGIIYDVEKDGTLDQLSLKNKLSDGGKHIAGKLGTIRTNLETHFGEITTVNIADFEDYCDDDGDGVINKWDFVIALNPVNNAQFSTPYISNSVEIILPYGATDATAKVTNGTVVLNGIDTGVLNTSVSSLDTVAIKLTSVGSYNVSVSGILSVTYTATGAGSQENKGTFVVTTSCESGVSRTIDCEGGTQNQICNDGIWSNVGNCEPKNCTTEGSFREISCGSNGKQTQKCVSSLWVNDGACVEKLTDPIFNIPAGTYQTAQNVEITHPENGVVIKYTVNDPFDPSEGYGLVYTAPINIPTDETVETVRTIKAKAYKSGFETSNMVTREYTVTGKVATPQFNFGTGTYNTEKSVTITTATIGVTIKYTLDGTTPNETNGTVYANPINIVATTNLKASAYKTNWLNSTVQSADYTMKMADPVFSVLLGTYTTTQNITLSTLSPHSEIRYTTNGDAPDETSPLYTGAINLPTDNVDEYTKIIKAKTFSTEFGWLDSEVITNTYKMTGVVQTPVLSPDGGTYTTSQSVTITCATNGAAIRYTTNGDEPTTSSPLYSAPFTLEDGAITTVKAKAFRTDWVTSATASATYTIDNIPAPTITPDGGVFDAPVQNVTITTPINGATIRYTLDGTEPTGSSAIYSGPMTFAVSRHLVAKVFNDGLTGPQAEKGYIVGKEITTKQWGTTSDDSGSSVAVDSNGNIYVVGSTNGFLDGNTNAGGSDIFLTKWNADGTNAWTKQWGTIRNDYGKSIAVNARGDIYVTGTIETPETCSWGGLQPHPCQDIILIKWDSYGNELWYRQRGSTEDDSANAIKIASDDVYIFGSTLGSIDGNSNAGGTCELTPCSDMFISKFKEDGEWIWTKQWGTTAGDIFSDGVVDNSGNIILTGYCSLRIVSQTRNTCVLKFKSDGEFLWSKLWGSSTGTSVHTDEANDIYISEDTGDITLYKITSDGTDAWKRTWGTGEYDIAKDIAISEGSLTIAGSVRGSLDENLYNGGTCESLKPPFGTYPCSDIFVMKLDLNGDKIWTKQWGTNEDDLGNSITMDTFGNIFVAGETSGSLDGNTNMGGKDVIVSRINLADQKWNIDNIIATPTLGIYNTPQNVSLSCSTEGSDIRFEINNPEPDMFSNIYENPIEIAETSTLKAIAYKLGVAGYSKISPVYTIDEGLEQVAAPTFDPPEGDYYGSATLDLTIATTTPDATIRYTLDGSEPSAVNGYEYTGVITISDEYTIIKAKAFKEGMADSITQVSLFNMGYCGDGILQTDYEECDDSNLLDSDSCTSLCKLAKCGDEKRKTQDSSGPGISAQPENEGCDDGNVVDDGNGCSETCIANNICGNGKIENAIEICDDGNTNPLNNDYCRDDCQAIIGFCGDGSIQSASPASESCDNATFGEYGIGAYCTGPCTGNGASMTCELGCTVHHGSCGDGNTDYVAAVCVNLFVAFC